MMSDCENKGFRRISRRVTRRAAAIGALLTAAIGAPGQPRRYANESFESENSNSVLSEG